MFTKIMTALVASLVLMVGAPADGSKPKPVPMPDPGFPPKEYVRIEACGIVRVEGVGATLRVTLTANTETWELQFATEYLRSLAMKLHGYRILVIGTPTFRSSVTGVTPVIVVNDMHIRQYAPSPPSLPSYGNFATPVNPGVAFSFLKFCCNTSTVC